MITPLIATGTPSWLKRRQDHRPAGEEGHQRAVGVGQISVGGELDEVLHIPVAHHVGEGALLHHGQHQSDHRDHAPAGEPGLDDDAGWR